MERLTALPGRLFRWWHDLPPPTLFVASFLLLILVCTFGLLALPGLYTGERLHGIDALFTATSAVCVTGLIVVDTATHFTFWGQLYLLVFIQLGGLGLLTLTSVLIGAMGRRLSLRSEMITLPSARFRPEEGVVELMKAVVKFPFVVGLCGAVVLFFFFVFRHPVHEALWHAVFHAVSAFCNAGFSTYSDSLMSWQRHPGVLVTVSLLVIVGGLGYFTILEVRRYLRQRRDGVRVRLSSHSSAVLWVTGILLVSATALYAWFEWGEVLRHMSAANRLSNAWFMSVTSRTAGFNSVSYTDIGNDSAYLTILLMMVGGSPGSTAGGLKTTTLAVLAALAISKMRQLPYVELRGRGIPDGTIQRTVGLALLAFFLVTGAVFLLNAIEDVHVVAADAHRDFLPLMFEAVSAFATCGLSMDRTFGLDTASRLVVIGLMFVGRVGLLSFFTALTLKRPVPGRYRPAHEDVVVG